MGTPNLTPRINRLEPNVIINGGMELRQRMNATGALSNAYSLDRFYVNNLNTSMTTLIDQSSTVPSGTNLNSAMRVYNTTTGSLVAGTQCDVRYRVEGYDVLPLINDEFTLIFWARSSVAGTYSVSIKNTGTTHSYVRQFTITSANTYELKAVKFPALSTCPGTINRTNGIGLEVKWSIVTGTTFQTGSLNAWQAGNFEAGAGQVTSWLTSGNEFLLTGIMALPGDWEALTSSNYKFIRAGRNFEEEFGLAQRYYEKSYNLDIAPGAIGNTDGMGQLEVGTATTLALYTPWRFASRKRAVPSVITYSDLSATQNRVSRAGVEVTSTVFFVGTGGFSAGSATGGSAAFMRAHWTADAEL